MSFKLDSVTYASKGGYQCPGCDKESDMEVLKRENNTTSILETIVCHDCQNIWKAHYLLTGYKIKEGN